MAVLTRGKSQSRTAQWGCLLKLTSVPQMSSAPTMARMTCTAVSIVRVGRPGGSRGASAVPLQHVQGNPGAVLSGTLKPRAARVSDTATRAAVGDKKTGGGSFDRPRQTGKLGSDLPA